MYGTAPAYGRDRGSARGRGRTGRHRPRAGRPGPALLLEKLVDAVLLLFHPLARGGALQQVFGSFRRGHAFEEPSAGVGFGCQARGVGAQVEIAIGQQEGVGENDFVIHAADGDDGGGAVLPALPDVADAFGLAQRAAEKGVDAGVTDAVLADIEPHVVGGVAGASRAAECHPRRRGACLRVGHGEIEFAVAEAVAAAAREQALAIRDHLGDRRGAAVLHQRLGQVGASAGSRLFHRLRAEDRTGEVFLRGTLLVRPAGRGERNEFPDRGRLAILDLSFFEKRAGHGSQFSSFFPSACRLRRHRPW